MQTSWWIANVIVPKRNSLYCTSLNRWNLVAMPTSPSISLCGHFINYASSWRPEMFARCRSQKTYLTFAFSSSRLFSFQESEVISSWLLASSWKVLNHEKIQLSEWCKSLLIKVRKDFSRFYFLIFRMRERKMFEEDKQPFSNDFHIFRFVYFSP